MRSVVACCWSLDLPRPHRLVLVPMGEFGPVPWHAAQAPTGRYLVQDAVISYAASGRLFCDSVAGRPIPVDAGALVVGHPTDDSPYAADLPHAAAATIRTRLYPRIRFPGADSGPDPDRATAAHLLGWLTTTMAQPCGVLHLGCPATASSLVLAGESAGALPRVLSAKDLVHPPQRTGRGYQLGTVVLAACSSGPADPGRAEACSVANAFLATGARSVVASSWPVPDGSTELLIYLFHHYLTEDRIGAAYALRLAQLWMLDPARRLPRTLPPGLWERAAAVDPHDLSGWAGVRHLGRW